MKYLKYFQTETERSTYKSSSDFILPNVNYVVESDSVDFDPYVPPVPKNVITYYANEKLVETTSSLAVGLHVNVFNSPMISHEFVDGVGTITFEEDITTIGNRAFLNCTGLTGITIPDSVTTIGSGIFFNCSGLTSIVIPESVDSIGHTAFGGCSGLTEITCHAIVAPSIKSDTFSGVKSAGTLYVPIGSTSNYSTWMENTANYLGYYNWIIKEM